MLGGAYHWKDGPEGSFLNFNAGFVARVVPCERDDRGRAAEVKIEHLGKRFHVRAGSVAQGKRFVEEWIRAQSRRMWRPRRSNAPTGAPRVRTAAEVLEWQRREAEISARLMREAGWRDCPNPV